MNNKQAPDIYETYAVYNHPAYFEKMHKVEWRGQLQSSTGGRLFSIKYYGELYKWVLRQEEKYLTLFHQEYGKAFNGLIVSTGFAPELIYAVDVITGEEILLFDGCTQGYDNLFYNEWTVQQLNQRRATRFYADVNGNEVFKIVIHTYSNVDYKQEYERLQNDEGDILLINGEIVDIPYLQRNGFDAICINAYNKKGEMATIHEAELAKQR
ncbi:hypothetical protein [Pedobacter sp. UBA5917]|jgi:hypothetical protein|uniref:hypothetical protein n=1 Tax=Pedobacter sp. UBA5917 TaxID=1947061 RepID=UPI0025F9DA47|nr:hypothetical protein [Pedobacter sp. UBA5917]